jgi:DNA invertase Pin-like site-specific DNA recombinase
MSGRTSNAPSSHLARAAQYLRMSTEHQQYSIANQSAAIALYAAAHDIGIVRSFVDAGKSGTSIKKRLGLQELLGVVESGTADFDQVLVYDVSRWGRFPDCDEAAHYEFLCKRAGIAVRYCAEQFENDNSTPSNLLKALKRTMAGEYSRELSVKISVGQRRLAGMGFWQGGVAPFGFVRQLIGENGEPKQILSFGEWKNIITDRVVLVPGPQQAIDTIRLAFDLYTKQGKNRREIVEILNGRKHFIKRRPWKVTMLRELFTNPLYKGAYAYGKHEIRINYHKTLPREQWLVRENAFPAIISEKQWTQARDRVMRETKPFVDSEMLEALRRLWNRKGRLNSDLIHAAKDIPSPVAYRSHFGSLNEAYKLIGYPYPRECSYVNAVGMMRRMRKALCDEICDKIRASGGTAQRLPRSHGVIYVNGNIRVQVTFCTGRQWRTGFTVWTLYLGKQPTADILIIARLHPPIQAVGDYYVIPTCAEFRGVLHVRGTKDNAPFLDPYHFTTLEPVIETFGRFPMSEVT